MPSETVYGDISDEMNADSEYVTIRLLREDAEAMAGDLHRASVNAVLDVENQERQGIASDLNAILSIFNEALEA